MSPFQGLMLLVGASPKQNNTVFLQIVCLKQKKKEFSSRQRDHALALVVADSLRMAIPIIIGGNSGSSKKGEIPGLLTSPLDPPVGCCGGGRGL